MTWNESLQDEIIEAQTDLLRLAKATGDDLVALLDKSDADIKALLLDLESTGAVTDAQYAEISKAQELIAQRRAEAWGQVSLNLTSRVNEIAIEAHGGLMSAILTATGGEIVPTVVATSALVSIAESRPFEGRILSEWAGKLQSDDLARFARTIQLGMVRGAAPAQIARDIYGAGGVAEMGRSAIMAVVRTATNHVANEAQALFIAQNEYLTRERYVATLDARTTRQCFDGSTEIMSFGGVKAITRRWYEGEMIVVTTAGGNKIRGTPNHPILTTHGWLPLHEIKPGAKVMNSGSHEVSGVGSDEDVSVPSIFGAVFDALNHPSVENVLSVSSSPADFHGDGMGPDNEIDIVPVNGDLGRSLIPSVGKHVEDDLFRLRHLFPDLLGGGALGEHLIGRPPSIQSSQVNSGPVEACVQPGFGSASRENSEYLGRPDAGTEEINGILLVPDDELVNFTSAQCRADSGALQEGSYCRHGSSVFSGYGTSGSSGGIFCDDIVSVAIENTACHVYNLHTDEGFYIAGGFIVKNCASLDGKVFAAGEGPRPPLHYNCRSRRVPFIDGDAYAKGGRGQVSASRSGAARAYEEAGRPKGGFEAFRRQYFRDRAGPVPADTTYGQWLKSRPAALQDDILGPTRGKLFRDGGLKIEQFTTEGGRTLTLAELRAKHAAAFKRAGLTEE